MIRIYYVLCAVLLQIHLTFVITNNRSTVLLAPVPPMPLVNTSCTVDLPLAIIGITPIAAAEGTNKSSIQKNTLRALLLLRPEVEVLVFTFDQESIHLCQSLGIPNASIVREFGTNPHGTPKVRSLFEFMESVLRNRNIDNCATKGVSFIGYANADIMFDSTLLRTLETIRRAIGNTTKASMKTGKAIADKVLIVGRRTNVERIWNLENQTSNHSTANAFFNRSTADTFVKELNASGNLFRTDAQDYFFFTPQTFYWDEIPNFVVGRPGYDNWLVDYVYHKKFTHSVVDGTLSIRAIHQTGEDGNKAGHNPRVDKTWNTDLGKRKYDHGLTVFAPWETVLDPYSLDVVIEKRNMTNITAMEKIANQRAVRRIRAAQLNPAMQKNVTVLSTTTNATVKSLKDLYPQIVVAKRKGTINGTTRRNVVFKRDTRRTRVSKM